MLGDLDEWTGDCGWCHGCETWQFYSEARIMPCPWWRGAMRACVGCDEDWGGGVWPMAFCDVHRADGERMCREHVQTYDGPGDGCADCVAATIDARILSEL